MSRFAGLGLDPSRRGERRITTPGAALRLRTPDIPRFAPSGLARAGEDVGRGLMGLAGSLDQIRQQAREVTRRQWLADFSLEALKKRYEAVHSIRDAPDTEEAVSQYEAQFEDMRARLDEIEDPRLKASAISQFTGIYAGGFAEARKIGFNNTIARAERTETEFEKSLLESVGEGANPSEAIALHEERAMERQVDFGEQRTIARIESFRKTVAATRFNYLLNENPQAAIDYLETDLAKEIDPEQRGRMKARAERELSVRSVIAIEDARNELVNVFDAMFQDGNIPTKEVAEIALDDHSGLVNELSKKINDRPEIPATRELERMTIDILGKLSSIGNEEGVEILSSISPDTLKMKEAIGAARSEISRIKIAETQGRENNLLTEIRQRLSDVSGNQLLIEEVGEWADTLDLSDFNKRRVQEMVADRLRSAKKDDIDYETISKINSGELNPNELEYFNPSPNAVNKAWRDQIRFSDEATVLREFVENGIGVPSEAISRLKSYWNTEPIRAVSVVSEIIETNRIAAIGIANQVDSTGLLDAAIILSDDESAVSVLTDPQLRQHAKPARDALSEVGVQEQLGNNLVSPEVGAIYRASYMRRYIEALRDGATEKDAARHAQESARDDVNSRSIHISTGGRIFPFTNLEHRFTRGQFVRVPADLYEIGNDVQMNSKLLKTFERSVRRSAQDIGGTPKVELGFKSGEDTYIPVMVQDDPVGFVRWRDGSAEGISQQNNPSAYRSLRNLFLNRTEPIDRHPYAEFRNRPEYGVSTISEYDRKNGGSGLAEPLRARLLADWEAEWGEPFDPRNPDDVSFMRSRADRIARELGWSGWGERTDR